MGVWGEIGGVERSEDEPPKRNTRGTRWHGEVPEEWIRLGYALRQKAGLARINLRLEAEKFADFWSAKSGAGAAKLNWLATWRNWCRSARGVAETEPPKSPTPCADDWAALKRVELYMTKGIRTSALGANDFRLAVRLGKITAEQAKRAGF